MHGTVGDTWPDGEAHLKHGGAEEYRALREDALSPTLWKLRAPGTASHKVEDDKAKLQDWEISRCIDIVVSVSRLCREQC